MSSVHVILVMSHVSECSNLCLVLWPIGLSSSEWLRPEEGEEQKEKEEVMILLVELCPYIVILGKNAV